MKKPAPRDRSLGAMAEEEGFEPSYPRRGKRFSRPPHSTTLPPLRRVTWPLAGPRKVLAESQGFEPWRRFRRLHDFQSCSFGHSDNSPCNAALASIAYAPSFGKAEFKDECDLFSPSNCRLLHEREGSSCSEAYVYVSLTCAYSIIDHHRRAAARA